MDIFTTSTRIRELQSALDKVEGISGRSVDLYFWGSGVSAVRLEVGYRETASYNSERHEFIKRVTHDEIADGWGDDEGLQFDLDTWLDTAMTEALTWIAQIPSQAEREHNAFIRQVGRLIDSGRDIGIDVAFLNPLTDMMTRLSENILEDKRGQL
jgi:hypothetical protein